MTEIFASAGASFWWTRSAEDFACDQETAGQRVVHTGGHMSRLLIGAVVGFALTGTANASYDLSYYGSGALISNRDCDLPSSVSCSVSDPISSHYYGGGNAYIQFEALNIDGSGGNAFGRTDQDPGSLMPILGVGSYSGEKTRLSVNVSVYQSFTYTGSEAIDLAIKGLLHYENTASPSTNAYGSGYLSVFMNIFPVSKLAELPANPTGQDIYTLPFFNFAGCGSGSIANTVYNSGGLSGGVHSKELSLSTACGGGAITLNPGATFVVQAIMQGVTNRNGFVDAMHTLEVQYDAEKTVYSGTTQSVGADFFAFNFSALGPAVPEPATWAMMMAGFGLVGTAGRRRRRSAVTCA